MATPDLPEIDNVYHVDESVKPYWGGASAQLSGTLKPAFFFKNLSEDTTIAVTFTDFRGNEHDLTFEYDDLETLGERKYFLLEELTVADINQIVTINVTIINGEGQIVGTIVDSMASYIERAKIQYVNDPEIIAVYDAILKFSKSAYDYFMN